METEVATRDGLLIKVIFPSLCCNRICFEKLGLLLIAIETMTLEGEKM